MKNSQIVFRNAIKMTNHKLISRVATAVTVVGILYQIYTDRTTEAGHNYGTYIFMLGLLIYIVNENNNEKPKNTG